MNHVIIQEEISEDLESLPLRCWVRGIDRKWSTLYRGTSVGQKKYICFKPSVVRKIKVVFTNVKADPQIANFSAYYIEDVIKDGSKFYDSLSDRNEAEPERVFENCAT